MFEDKFGQRVRCLFEDFFSNFYVKKDLFRSEIQFVTVLGISPEHGHLLDVAFINNLHATCIECHFCAFINSVSV